MKTIIILLFVMFVSQFAYALNQIYTPISAWSRVGDRYDYESHYHEIEISGRTTCNYGYPASGPTVGWTSEKRCEEYKDLICHDKKKFYMPDGTISASGSLALRAWEIEQKKKDISEFCKKVKKERSVE